jgi:5S rRNA maturation endonuclease (ribonuclease M5)
MSRKEEAMERFPLESYIRSTGKTISTQGKEPKICCYFHDDKHPSLRFNNEKGLWNCDPCGIGGNVIDLHMRINGLSFLDALDDLLGKEDERKPSPPAKANDAKLTSKPTTTEYTYCDAYGTEVFRVKRIDNMGTKTFRQYHHVDGKPVFSMDGVMRVLYRLDQIADKEQVWLVEGEKCVQAMVEYGYDATTNSGGSNGWLDAYADDLKNKDVIIMPDNDEPGVKWHKTILDSLAGKVKSIQTLRVPEKYNDVADLFEDLGADGHDVILDLQMSQPVISRGVDVPIYSAQETVDRYAASVRADHRISVDLGKWLPTLRHQVRPLIPGEMITIMADTGQGKSAALQNIAVTQNDLTVLYFQLELPLEHMGERFLAIDQKMPCATIEKAVRACTDFDTRAWSHIYTCDMAGLSLDQIDEIIVKSELKMGKKPDVVMIDYIGLVAGTGNRYQRMSDIAEGMKVLAKKRSVILFVASQVGRPPDDDGEVPEVNLHDAKDSGSIENSSSLVLGCWRPEREKMIVKILKNTKGFAGTKIPCNYNGPALRITEEL